MTRRKTTYRHCIGTIALTLTLIVSGSCSDDTPDNSRTMHLVSATRSFTEVTTGVTRALPAGYEALDMTTTTVFPNNKDMLAFITPEKTNPTSSDIFIRRFTYFNDWQTNITIKDATTPYYITPRRRYIR